MAMAMIVVMIEAMIVTLVVAMSVMMSVVIVLMVMRVVMMGVVVLTGTVLHACPGASAYGTHQITSSSLMRSSSPPVTLRRELAQHGQ